MPSPVQPRPTSSNLTSNPETIGGRKSAARPTVRPKHLTRIERRAYRQDCFASHIYKLSWTWLDGWTKPYFYWLSARPTCGTASNLGRTRCPIAFSSKVPRYSRGAEIAGDKARDSHEYFEFRFWFHVFRLRGEVFQ